MNVEHENEAVDGVDQGGTAASPRKLLLGKRVLRHFNVRTSIQTGALTDGDTKSDGGPALSGPGTTGGSTRLRCY